MLQHLDIPLHKAPGAREQAGHPLKQRGLSAAAVRRGRDEQAELVDQVLRRKGAVEQAAALQKQLLNAEIPLQLGAYLREADLRRPAEQVGDPQPPQIGQIAV